MLHREDILVAFGIGRPFPTAAVTFPAGPDDDEPLGRQEGVPERCVRAEAYRHTAAAVARLRLSAPP